jgi:phosphoribosylanthranilate isomerase
MTTSGNRIEIKICGLTTPEMAELCADAGVDAIGMIFFPPSPRHVSPQRARQVAAAVPEHVARVGVFVEHSAATILEIATFAGLNVVQLVGASASAATPLREAGLHVVQMLSTNGAALTAQSCLIPVSDAVLVECGKGILPGGNGATWNWSGAAALRTVRPYAIAGGLTPENVADAILASGASSVDVSSGVESSRGVKNIELVRTFIAAVRATPANATGPVFCRKPFENRGNIA